MTLATLKSRDQFGEWLNANGLNGIGVEVGTLCGEYMETIMRVWGGRMICIDPWEKQPPGKYREPVNDSNWTEIYQSAKQRADQFDGRVLLVQGYSPDCSVWFSGDYLDFVYLDGRHDLEAVTADLKAWWPKVKKGGVLGGHDYYVDTKWPANCEVKTAVDEFVSKLGLKIHTTNAPGDQGWWILRV